jgi:hypothetical protein
VSVQREEFFNKEKCLNIYKKRLHITKFKRLTSNGYELQHWK